MLTAIKKLLGLGPKVDYAQLMDNGAVIIDVRSAGEYRGGHIPGSKNIPLQNLSGHISKLDKKKPIITCCASGMRSGSAKSMLKAKGFEVYNGGSWMSLQHKL